MKKTLSRILCVVAIFLMVTNVQASTVEPLNRTYQGKINVGLFEREYKSSVDNIKKVLPFINIAAKDMTYDKDILSSGISFGNESISVEKSLKGFHVLLGGDTITVDGKLEYSLIMAPNVVINGKVDKDILIMAESVFITESADIGNDVTIITNKAEVKGEIKGNLIATCEDLYFSGNVGKDLRISSKSFKAEKETISGDVYIETDSDTSYIKGKYKDAKILQFATDDVNPSDTKVSSDNIAKYIVKGIVVAVVYTLLTYLLTKKDNNIVDKVTEKSKEYMSYLFLMGILLIIIMPVLFIGLPILAIFGLGIIAWPIFVAYLAFIILACILDIFVTGLVIGNIITKRISKEKLTQTKRLGIYAGVFAVIYMLTEITVYASMLCMIISIGVLFTYITRKAKVVKVEEKAGDEK